MLQGFVSDGDDHPILLVGHFPRRCDEAIRQISPVCPVIDAVRPSCQAMARRTPRDTVSGVSGRFFSLGFMSDCCAFNSNVLDSVCLDG